MDVPVGCAAAEPPCGQVPAAAARARGGCRRRAAPLPMQSAVAAGGAGRLVRRPPRAQRDWSKTLTKPAWPCELGAVCAAAHAAPPHAHPACALS